MPAELQTPSQPPQKGAPAPEPHDEAPSPPAPADSLPPLGPLPPQPYPGAPPLDAILRAATAGARGHPPQQAAVRDWPTMERYDEKCWTRTKQTNARRALGREPQTSMYCFLNFRNSLADLVPVPGSPNSFLARDVAPGAPDEHSFKRKPKAPEHEALPEYHWPWLDGRYVYVARGREAVMRHMKEMGGVAGEQAKDGVERGPMIMRKSGEEEKAGAWDTIGRIEERCERLEAEKMLPGKREEQLLRRALGLDEDDSERLISLSDYWSTSLRRLHAHILRIYTPAFTQLARLPSTFTDGTQLQMLDTVTTRLTDGSAYNLAGRLYQSFWTVQEQLGERRKRRIEQERNSREGGGFGGMGGFGGFGGSQPPVPPPAAPRAAEPEQRNVGAEEGNASSAEAKPPGKEDWIRGPGGKLYPPGTRFVPVACSVM
ncbi:hypothetical protein JCM10213_007629 [Rhodosporidiobolus nylandii]